MPRDLILGTAGHIDHGKTALVKALTGIDTDRLPEEKSRGITIDIGFAALDLGDFRLGVVDVPGHERFVKNMLAGATGFDLALLVIAADDGVMPQTREHLEILRLLGLTHGVVAVTKADAVDATTLAVAVLEVRELVAGTFLEAAEIVPTSAVTGAGIPELKLALATAAAAVAEQPEQPFRMAIDRAFVVQGHGTVVTGSVAGGRVRVGDELDWHTGDGTTQVVRVRGLNVHGEAVTAVGRGRRAAVNLAGVPREAVRRGQDLAAPGFLVPARVLSVRMTALAAGGKAIRHRLPVRVHVGTAEVMGTVSVLDFDRIDAGKWALAQLFLDTPVATVWGQPFVVREASGERTLGGGQVLQPGAVKLRRRHFESQEKLEQLWLPAAADRAAAAAWFAGFTGITPADLPRLAGVPPADAAAVTAATLVELAVPPARKLWLHAGRVADAEERILTVLAGLHAEHPLMTNHDRPKTLSRLAFVGDDALVQVVIDRMIRGKKLLGDAKRIARADFKPVLTANQRKLKDAIVEDHRVAGFAPPDPTAYANRPGGTGGALKDVFAVAAAEGFLVKISDDVYLHADAEAEMRAKVAARLAAGPGATVADIRDALGTTRKFAVPFCEYLDRVGVTRRDGDLRVAADSGTEVLKQPLP